MAGPGSEPKQRGSKAHALHHCLGGGGGGMSVRSCPDPLTSLLHPHPVPSGALLQGDGKKEAWKGHCPYEEVRGHSGGWWPRQEPYEALRLWKGQRPLVLPFWREKANGWSELVGRNPLFRDRRETITLNWPGLQALPAVNDCSRRFLCPCKPLLLESTVPHHPQDKS